MRRLLVTIGLLAASVSIVLVVTPVGREQKLWPPTKHPAPFGYYLSLERSCRAPIADAPHGRTVQVTDGTTTMCQGEARHRLILSYLFLIGGAGLVLVALLAHRPRTRDLAYPRSGLVGAP